MVTMNYNLVGLIFAVCGIGTVYLVQTLWPWTFAGGTENVPEVAITAETPQSPWLVLGIGLAFSIVLFVVGGLLENCARRIELKIQEKKKGSFVR